MADFDAFERDGAKGVGADGWVMDLATLLDEIGEENRRIIVTEESKLQIEAMLAKAEKEGRGNNRGSSRFVPPAEAKLFEVGNGDD